MGELHYPTITSLWVGQVNILYVSNCSDHYQSLINCDIDFFFDIYFAI